VHGWFAIVQPDAASIGGREAEVGMGRKTGIERSSVRQVQVAKADLNDGGNLWLRQPRENLWPGL